MIECGRLSQDTRRTGRQCPFAAEQQMVGVDHTGSVDFPSGQGLRCLAFAADVVTVQPDSDIEASDLYIRNALRQQMRDR